MPLYFRREIKRFLPAIPFMVASVAGMTALALSGTFLKRAQFLNVIFLLIAFLLTLDASAECIRLHREELTEKLEKVMNASKLKKYI